MGESAVSACIPSGLHRERRLCCGYAYTSALPAHQIKRLLLDLERFDLAGQLYHPESEFLLTEVAAIMSGVYHQG